MPVIRVHELAVKHPKPGWDSRFFHSEHVTFAYTEIAAGADVHPHHHEQEETWYVIEGELEVTVADERLIARAGEAVVVPGEVVHSARAVTACRVLVIDYPLRDSVGGESTH